MLFTLSILNTSVIKGLYYKTSYPLVCKLSTCIAHVAKNSFGANFGKISFSIQFYTLNPTSHFITWVLSCFMKNLIYLPKNSYCHCRNGREVILQQKYRDFLRSIFLAKWQAWKTRSIWKINKASRSQTCVSLLHLAPGL